MKKPLWEKNHRHPESNLYPEPHMSCRGSKICWIIRKIFFAGELREEENSAQQSRKQLQIKSPLWSCEFTNKDYVNIVKPSGVHCPRDTCQPAANEESSYSDGLTFLLLSKYPPVPSTPSCSLFRFKSWVLCHSGCPCTIWNRKAYQVKRTQTWMAKGQLHM